MKHLFALLFGMSSWGIFAQEISAEHIQFTIDGTTSREQLAEIHQNLYTQGIKFIYNPNLAPDRRLHGLSFTLTSNDGLIQGEGSHTKLNIDNSKIIVDIDKVNHAVDIQYQGER